MAGVVAAIENGYGRVALVATDGIRVFGRNKCGPPVRRTMARAPSLR